MATTESDRATITLRFLASPGDAGHSGSVSAGRVLEWIDKAGYAAAAGWSGRYCVTAYVGNVRFARPVEVGELVEATATLVYTGRTSMHITVTVSSGHPRTRELTEATHCLMVFVAVDDDGRATPVPTWTPASTSQIESRDWAVRRITLREQIEAAMTSQRYTDAGTAPRLVMRFLAAPTDVNWGGKVHGGVVMRWIDEAAHVLVTQWTKNARNVAIFTGGVRFYRPLRIGHLVEVEARLLHTGATSMHVGVHVRSGDPATRDLALTTYCRTIFVGLDQDGQALQCPPWEPRSQEDLDLDAHAIELAAIRQAFGE